jgi:membrane AbrB-like protein
MRRFLPGGETLIVVLAAVICGLVFQWLKLPAAWFFGPLAVTAVCAVRGFGAVQIPRLAYVAAQAVIGTGMGSAFAPKSLGLIVSHWGVVSFVVISILLTSLLNGWVLTWWAGLSARTAFLGTLPGGAGEMAAMSDSLQADTRLVAVMQYVRLLIIIASLLIVPKLLEQAMPAATAPAPAPLSVAVSPTVTWGDTALLLVLVAAGVAAGLHRTIPAGTLVVPALLYLGLAFWGHAPGRFPYPVFALAYLVMGLQIGSRFEPSTLTEIKRLAIPLLTTTALLMLCSVGLAAWLARELRLDTVSAYLAATPGGLDSVAAVATELHADSALIITVHLARLLAVLLLGPWLVSRGGDGQMMREWCGDFD